LPMHLFLACYFFAYFFSCFYEWFHLLESYVSCSPGFFDGSAPLNKIKKKWKKKQKKNVNICCFI
jgi:hypothetical protein